MFFEHLHTNVFREKELEIRIQKTCGEVWLSKKYPHGDGVLGSGESSPHQSSDAPRGLMLDPSQLAQNPNLLPVI